MDNLILLLLYLLLMIFPQQNNNPRLQPREEFCQSVSPVLDYYHETCPPCVECGE
jgi:hypothetical protein